MGVVSGVDWFDLQAKAVFEGGLSLSLPRLLQARPAAKC